MSEWIALATSFHPKKIQALELAADGQIDWPYHLAQFHKDGEPACVVAAEWLLWGLGVG